jgi:hypothetical protein
MTDIQVLTIAMAVIVPLSMLIYSNSRITEAKETLRAEIQAATAKLLTEIHALGSALKVHELEHHK